MVGMFVLLCLASKKSSEREFFVPAGTLMCKAVKYYIIPITLISPISCYLDFVTRSVTCVLILTTANSYALTTIL